MKKDSMATEPVSANATMLRPQQLGERWRVSPETLADWRKNGTGPTYVKLGFSATSLVRYMVPDIEAWEASLPRITPVAWGGGTMAFDRTLINSRPEKGAATMLTAREIAEWLGASEAMLKLWRMTGKGPTYVKLGFAETSSIRYMISDVEAWCRNSSE